MKRPFSWFLMLLQTEKCGVDSLTKQPMINAEQLSTQCVIARSGGHWRREIQFRVIPTQKCRTRVHQSSMDWICRTSDESPFKLFKRIWRRLRLEKNIPCKKGKHFLSRGENAKISFLFAHSIELEAVERHSFGENSFLLTRWWWCGLQKSANVNPRRCSVSLVLVSIA